MRELVIHSGHTILENYSGKKGNRFKISIQIERQIDAYITNAQTKQNFSVEYEFKELQNKILNDKSDDLINFTHDIDLLFKDKNGEIYYVEIKYNDDHDTGKFININRKFIKTYAYLVLEFSRDIKPILFYFNNKRMKGNIYLNEKENIYRVERFFKEFLKFNYNELSKKLENFANSDENRAKFDELYNKIMKI